MYKCIECGKEAKHRNNIGRHIEGVHKRTNAGIPIKRLRQIVRNEGCVLTPDQNGQMFSGEFLIGNISLVIVCYNSQQLFDWSSQTKRTGGQS